MNERLLQYIWQYQYFNTQSLTTISEEPVSIINPGSWNTNQGPDFILAVVKIANVTWAGSVEIHLQSSDWNRHRHAGDLLYEKVILHVVWHNDINILDSNATPIPTIELQDKVSKLMLNRFENWMKQKQTIACQGQWENVSEITWKNWQDRMLIERLEEKAQHIYTLLNQHNNHWEEVCWIMVCRYFGGSVNAESFEQVATSLPINLLAKYKQQIHQLESLLLGQAGLLYKHVEDDYALMLYKEYQYLQQKHQLRVVNRPPVFLRLRPQNFPTIRLAQLANLVLRSVHLFSNFIESTELPYQHLQCTANDYWLYHFKFDELSSYSEKKLGRQMQDIIIINAITPLLFAYGKLLAKPDVCEKAMNWLQKIPAEKNNITNCWQKEGLDIKNAAESQAMLTLTKSYCHPRRCLDCAVGNALLKKDMVS